MGEIPVEVCTLCTGERFFFNKDGSVTECVCRSNKVMQRRIPNLYVSPDKWNKAIEFEAAWIKNLSLVYKLQPDFESFKCQAGPTLAQIIYEGKRCRLIDGLKLASVYFNRDSEFESTSSLYSHIAENIDLAIILIGFSDPNINNRHIIGDLITSLLTHCDMYTIPFWALLNVSLAEIQKHYGEQLYPYLNAMKYKFV